MKKGLLGGLVFMLLLIAGLYGIWLWFFCRFYVGPGQMAVIRANVGDALPPGQILAREGQKGIQERVLGEGRHFLNPYYFEWEVRDAISIAPGQVGLVTAKVGADLPEGEFIAGPGQKGIQRGVLGPGIYRLNPFGFNVDIINATSIQIGYVGVVSSQSGEQSPQGGFAGRNQKGTRQDVLQPGLYYINPKEFKVDVLEIGVNQVSLLSEGGGQVYTKSQLNSLNDAIQRLNMDAIAEQQVKRSDYINQNTASWKQVQVPPAAKPAVARKVSGRGDYEALAQEEARQVDQPGQMVRSAVPETPVLSFNQQVNFPSRDGFEISLDMTVEFEFTPDSIAWIFRSYGDLPQVMDTIILPQIASVSRLKGSLYGAKDFIVGEGREKFQKDLTDALARTLADKKIKVHNALIRHVNVPAQILTPIQEASVAIEQDLTNKEKQNTAKKQADLNTEMGLIDQSREKVMQETEKMRAEIAADQEKEVAEIQAGTKKLVAEIEKKTADVRAEMARTLGQAAAQVVQLVDGEKAKGLELKTKAFGDPVAYAQYIFASGLDDRLRLNIIHAGPGTLWTDLQGARLGDLGAARLLQEPQAAPPAAPAARSTPASAPVRTTPASTPARPVTMQPPQQQPMSQQRPATPPANPAK